MIPRAAVFVIALALLLALMPSAPASAQTPPGSLYFNATSDSIAIEGQTVLGTSATYEARVMFPASTGATGNIFGEWQAFAEDKLFLAGPSTIWGFNYPLTPILQFNGAVTADAWHHIAFVQDSSDGQQRLYLDGALVASQAASGDVSDGAGTATIGAYSRESLYSSFIGFIDAFRISDNTRYSGASFTAPTGDLGDDANTLLLYNFNKPDFFVDQGALKLTDLSGNGRTGTLGAGFIGATEPASPANQADLDCNGSINSVDALKVLRGVVTLSVSQTEPCPFLYENLLSGQFGDVDCSGVMNSIDALNILRYSAGLSINQVQPCVAFGEPV